MTKTLTDLTAATGRTVRAGLPMGDPCPVATGPAPVTQGDLIFLWRPHLDVDDSTWQQVPARGVVLVSGVHDHILYADPGSGVRWAPYTADELDVALIDVPAGAVGWCLHTDEHGAQGLGNDGLKPGRWLVRGQQEWTAAGARRVAD